MPRAALALALAALSGGAWADMELATRHIPQAQAIGTARLSFLFWDVYDATLYAADGQWRADAPYALSLSYLRQLDGDKIAERSAQEIRGQGFSDEDKLDVWRQQMRELFPDVDENTTLTGVRDENGHALFYRNGVAIGGIKDAEFSDWFFGIWLSENTSEPQMRMELLGIDN